MGNKREKEILNRCTDYQGRELGILDCYGVLSLENSDMSDFRYDIYDHKHYYTVAYISNPRQFEVQGGYLYVVDKKPRATFEPATRKYVIDQLGPTGEMITARFDKPDQAPAYLKIEAKSGVVTPYQTYDQMPAIDRAVFQQLKDR